MISPKRASGAANRILLTACLLAGPCNAGKIVYPWRAKKEIVKRGGVAEIWFDRDSGEVVQGVRLVGPHNSLGLSPDKIDLGSWLYDDYTKAAYDTRILATVPASSPLELYQVEVTTSKGKAVSNGSLRVIQDYPSRYYFLQFSDPHASVSWGPYGSITAPVQQALVDFIDIIDPEFVVCTGDNIIGFSRTTAKPARFRDRWDDFFDGDTRGLGGMDHARSPIFLSTGNNDYDSRKANPDAQKLYKLTEWNDFVGLRVYGFSYGDLRLLSFDDYLVELDDHGGTGTAKDFPEAQSQVLERYLAEAGAGKLRITMQHDPERVNAAFVDRNKVRLSLVGHVHRNAQATVGLATTRLTTTQLVFAEYWSPGYTPPNSAAAGVRMIEVRDGAVASHTPISAFDYGKIMKGNPGAFLTITYGSPNDGKAASNSAVIKNDIDYDFFSGKVRFVMRKGAYSVDNGLLQQVIENDSNTICDVKIPIGPRSSATVNIRPRPAGTRPGREFGSSLASLKRSSPGWELEFSPMVAAIAGIRVVDLDGKVVRSLPAARISKGRLRLPPIGLHGFRADAGMALLDLDLRLLGGGSAQALLKLPGP